MSQIDTLLIANRGEIAVRIMRTAQSLGIKTVAVYSEADANALHVRRADQSVCIGPAPVVESYLRGDRILDVARELGVDAIHPGYGFLSENAGFAQACEDAGIKFVGPSVHAIDVMGDKARAKRAMIEAGVPCIPGYQGVDQNDDTLLAQAQEVGLPVMVKAAAGGGGRGMRLVDDPAQLASAIELARAEAQNAFGSGDLIIEKAVVNARHVEVQVFADRHGNTVHLGERDCSVQRRHQKVVEEAPCPVMTPELREAMGAAAIEAAKAVNYEGAGTVEFLLAEDGAFYFLEMNTRLQVEHPVTELITGFDLVEWQLRVARGEPLPVAQEDIALSGHAIEVRLYAEDPSQGFLPSTGSVDVFDIPNVPGLRVDAGIETGDEVSPFYDAMVAKVIAHGDTRDDARRRLIRALAGAGFLGLNNNRDFLLDVLKQSSFTAGEATTDFIGECYPAGVDKPVLSSSLLGAAAVIQHVLSMTESHAYALSVSEELLDWDSTRALTSIRQYEVADELLTLRLSSLQDGAYQVACNGTTMSIVVEEFDEDRAQLRIDDRLECYRFYSDGVSNLSLSNHEVSAVLTDLTRMAPEDAEAAGEGSVCAPMHGQLVAVDVAVGDKVEQGQRVAVLEAMKMQHECLAAVAGEVLSVAAQAGQQVAAGDLILIIDADDAEAATE